MLSKMGFFSRACSFKRFVAPGKPIDGIVRVLQKVGTGLVDKPVGKCVVSHLVSLSTLDLVAFYT